MPEQQKCARNGRSYTVRPTKFEGKFLTPGAFINDIITSERTESSIRNHRAYSTHTFTEH